MPYRVYSGQRMVAERDEFRAAYSIFSEFRRLSAMKPDDQRNTVHLVEEVSGRIIGNEFDERIIDWFPRDYAAS